VTCVVWRHTDWVVMLQSWQEANKSSGICSVCRTTRQLHHKDDTVHKHGSRDKPYPGSHKPPLTSVKGANNVSLSLSKSSLDTLYTSATSTAASNIADMTSVSLWKPTVCGGVKSARSTCSVHLAQLLRAATQHPTLDCSWLAILKWSECILRPPVHDSKRHNLSNTIRQRITEFSSTTQPSTGNVNGPNLQRSDPRSTVAQAISMKLKDGNLRAAISRVFGWCTCHAIRRDTHKP